MRPDRGHRHRGWHTALATCLVLGLAAAPTIAQEPRTHGKQKLMGLNIDLFSTATDESDADIEYLPQLWFGIGGERMSWVDDQLMLPDGVGLAIAWFRGNGHLAFAEMGDEPVGGDLDHHRAGTHFAMWQQRLTYAGRVKLVAGDVEPLNVKCGYHWRLALDFDSAPWFGVVLWNPPRSLRSPPPPPPVIGNALTEVVWFPCVAR